MKKIIYNILSISIFLTTLTFISCSEDPTPSLYDVIEPAAPLPVDRLYNFDEKTKKEIPYGITVDPSGVVFVSLDAQGIKKITGDSLTAFAPKGPESFFRAMTYGSDSAVYAVRGGIRGIYRVVKNTIPAAFVSTSQGIADNVNDVEFINSQNVLWAGGSSGLIYRITLAKNVKKFDYIKGTINAIKVGNGNFFAAMRDTNNNEVVWKFPVISQDSLGAGELFFNFTEKVDSVAKISDIAIGQNGELYICTNKQSIAMVVVNSDKTFSEFYDGLINGAIYSFAWGTNNYGYFTNILVEINTDVWKVDMKKLSAQ
jgi:hypothetical protein